MSFTMWLIIFAAIFLTAIIAAVAVLLYYRKIPYAIALAVITVISAVILYVGFAGFITGM